MSKKHKAKRQPVSISRADLERGYLVYFASVGGITDDMELCAYEAKARAIECAAVLDYLTK